MSNRMDTAISKIKGVMKGVRARRDGLTGVFATLAEQHTQVATLIDRVEADPSKRTSLWPKIRIELLSHERAELREVYSVLVTYIELERLADQHENEAMDLEQLIEQLDDADIDSDDWSGLFDQLAGTVLDHAEWEEKQVFPVAQRLLGEQLTGDLDDRFRATKKQIADAV